MELTVGAHQQLGGWPLVRGIRYHTFETVLEIAGHPYRGRLPVEQREAYERNYRAATWPLSHYVEGEE